MAIETCAARGILRVVGYESVPGFDLPQPVTAMREVAALPIENRAPALAS